MMQQEFQQKFNPKNIAQPPLIRDFEPNKAQKDCIDNLHGKLMVLAGPGTGKTFTLIQRIKAMLNLKIEPGAILCLTFSDAAAVEMRTRLIKEVGVLASSVNVYTYHSFCFDIIKQNPMQFQLSADFRQISETQKLKLIKEAIDEFEPKFFLAPNAPKYHYAKDFVSLIEKLKTKRISKEEYLKNIETNPGLMPRLKELEAEIKEREAKGKTQNITRYKELEKIKLDIERAKELWELYEIYSRKMLEHSLIDFSDMIIFVLDQFEKDKAFLRGISADYKHLLVDEYQDTNELQNSVIFSLMENTGNNDNESVFVVGDDDQIIYEFQGAKNDNIEQFLIKFPETKLICLTENNRSTQPILDLGHLIVSKDITRLENNPTFKNKNITKKLTAKNQAIIEKTKKVRRIQFGDSLQEFNFVVKDIVALVNSLNSGNCPKDKNGEKELSEIAVISKTKAELGTFFELLKAQNIPCQINSGKSVFTIRSSILIYFYLQALNNHQFYSDKLFGLLLSEPFCIDLKDYNTLLHAKRLNGKNFIDNIFEMKNRENPEKIEKFIRTFDYLKEFSSKNNLRDTIVELINKTGILECYFKASENKTENILGIKKMVDEATEFSSLDPTAGVNEFVEYLNSALTDGIEITIDSTKTTQNAVQLITYHGSKGREFGHVYLPNLTTKAWEKGGRRNDYKLITTHTLDKEEEEAKQDSTLLKLLFVGITRAKYALTLSFADNGDVKNLQISKYLAFANDFDFEKEQFEFSQTNFEQELKYSLKREGFDNKKAFEQEIKNRIADLVLSPSSLNKYLTCPRQFFYTHILKIDVQEASWDAPNFGNTIHGTLEWAVKFAQNEGVYPSKESAKEKFLKKMEKTIFSKPEIRKKFEEKGLEVFENYYPHFCETAPGRVETETAFDNVEVGGNFVCGKIDRIEKNPDGTYSLYDYKTGTAASNSAVNIDGKKEDYFRQLCFYKYAFEKLTGKQVSDTALIYVEDHARSVHKTLGAQDMEYIENAIIGAYADINALKFEPVCDNFKDESCKYCNYKGLCTLDVL